MPSPIPLDSLLGATYIGIVVSAVVFGVTCLQVYLYYTEHSASDSRFLKTFVGVLLGIDTLHMALVSVVYYHYTVTNFSDFDALQRTTWSLGTQVSVGTVLSLFVQCFFAYRIYHLSQKKLVLPCIVTLLSLGQLVVGGVLYVIKGFQIVFFSGSSAALPFTTCAVALDFTCDIIIASSMIYYLYKNRSPIPRTNRVIKLLIIYTMNTCLLTTMCTFACLIALVTSPDTLIYAPWFFILVRLYSCSLMTTLNNRDTVRSKLEGGTDTFVSLPAFRVRGTDASASIALETPSERTADGGASKTSSANATKSAFTYMIPGTGDYAV